MRRVAALLAVLLCGCAEMYFKDQPLMRRWPVMGTYAEATVWGDGPMQARAMEHLRDSLDRSDLAMSNWRPDSGLSQLNRDARAGEALAAPRREAAGMAIRAASSRASLRPGPVMRRLADGLGMACLP